MRFVAAFAFVVSFLYCGTSMYYLISEQHAVSAAWGVLGVWFWQIGNSALRRCE